MATINLGGRKKRIPTSSKKDALRIYNNIRWRKIREEKIRLNPLCENCEEMGRTNPAEEIHHKIPFMQGRNQAQRERLAFDLDNLEALCIKCHKLRHAHLKN